MSTESWLIGSACAFQDQDIEINGSPVTVPFAYTGTYLEHALAALSMLKSLTAIMLLEGINGGAQLGEDGFVHITADAVFSITWTAAGVGLRDALGFTGDLAGADSYTADVRSSLLWIARCRNESPGKAPLGVPGSPRYRARRRQAPDGTQVTRVFGSPVVTNSFRWVFIDRDEFWTENQSGGELITFFGSVLVIGANFQMYRRVSADENSSDPVSLPTPLATYQYTGGNELPFARSSGFDTVDKRFDFTMPVLVVPEYTLA